MDGRVERASTAGEALIRWSGGLSDDVLGACRAGVHQFMSGGLRHRLVRLDGGGGERLLCTVQPLEAVRMRADVVLTPRQREVAAEAIVGHNVPQIATTLGVSAETIRKHLRLIYRRLGVHNRVQLARALW